MAVARIGLLWRGERGAEMSPRAQSMLGPLFDALADLDVDARAVVYADNAVREVRAELMDLDGVLVWVNPIQDGATRAQLDALLTEVADTGLWVSAHPDLIATLAGRDLLPEPAPSTFGRDSGCTSA